MLAAFGFTLGAGPAFGQDGDGSPPIIALRLGEGQEIDLDGRLEEDVWSAAVAIDDFTQQEPTEGTAPSERTEVRAAFDRDALYLGVMVFDDPDGIIAYQRQWDAFLSTDDKFAWVLDTFRDGRTGYSFEINAAGAMSDGIITGSGGGGFGGGRGGGGGGFGGVNRSWDGIWEAHTERRPNGWSAEIRIPFRTLNFDPGADAWGINFQRSIRRRNEEVLWRGFRRNQGLNRLVFAGRLEGLGDLSQGVGLEARASGIASVRHTPVNADPTTFPSDVSLDVSYSVTPSLRASVSFNTDFAEVESDERRVNLTRFPLRFPERRDFFLEGSGVFSFAPASGPQPFFSRRIGLAEGEPIPIGYGGRVTGQLGGTEIGFYQIGTRSHDLLDPGEDEPGTVQNESFTVARLRRRIFEQSSIGAIYTRRGTFRDTSGFAPDDRHTLGVDVEYKTRRFLGSNNFELEGFLVWNSNPDPAENRSFGDLSARGLRVDFPNDAWSGHVSYREFGDAYDPAVGFITRNSFRRVEPRFGWRPRPAIDWLRQLDFAVQFRSQWQLGSGLVEERQWQLDVLGVEFESGDNIELQATRTFEFLDEAFEISDGVEIADGDYTTWEYSVRVRTASRRPVSLFGGITLGEFWNGDRTRLDANVTFRPGPGISIRPQFERNDVRLPQGDFATNLYRLEGSWDPSPWLGLTNQLQYDDVTQEIGLFARLRWILTPGNDLFLVYTHNWQDLDDGLLDETRFVTQSRGGSVKLNYTYRF